MLLVSDSLCEFRIKREYTAQTNGNKSYFYTFENESLGSFELWSKDVYNLEKGKMYKLVFNLSFYQGNKRVDLVNVLEK